MTFKEYIKEYHPIKEQVYRKLKDPVSLILERDDLPCDEVRAVDGVLQKVVYISDEEFVPVFDLLSYTKEDVEKLKDADFKKVWLAYMENVDVQDLDIDSIITASKEYQNSRKRKKELIMKCTQ